MDKLQYANEFAGCFSFQEKPDQSDEILIGDYVLRVYSEFGPSESVSTFSIIRSSMPVIVTQNEVEELEKISSWVHDIFVWYTDESISEDELLDAIEYLISEGTITVSSD